METLWNFFSGNSFPFFLHELISYPSYFVSENEFRYALLT
jgi:hypothetical protein